MKPPKREPISPDLIEKVRESVRHLDNRAATARLFNLDRSTVLKVTHDIPVSGHKNIGWEPPPIELTLGDNESSTAVMTEPESVPELAPEPTPALDPEVFDSVKRKIAGDGMTIDWITDQLIETEDDLWAHSKLDRSIWYMLDMECSAYQGQMRVRRGQHPETGKFLADQPFHKQFWQIKARFRRLVPKPFQDATDAIFKRIADHAPAYGPIKYAVRKRPRMLIIDLYDIHFGKLAWAKESGQDYDLKIAERIFAEAVEDILAEVSGWEIERIIFTIGNDFFHIDSVTNQTTGGTLVDTDGRYKKIIEVGQMGMVHALERAASVAPVWVPLIPGNHDRTAAWHAANFLSAWFRNCPGVEVDTSPKTRKYVQYHSHLIGMTHGNEERPETLPLTMAVEEPELWQASQFREWHCGHFHSPKQIISRPVRSYNGVRVRNLHSLSATDSWHYLKGYVGGKRAAEAFLYDSGSGNVTGLEVSLRS